MEEQVLIHLLEANKELPTQTDVLQRFKADYADRLELALASPDLAVSENRETYQPAPVEPVLLRDEEPVEAASKPAGDGWEFAEDTNFERQSEPEAPAPEAEEQAEAPSFEPEASTEAPAEAAFEPATEQPMEEMASEPAYEPAYEPAAEPAYEPVEQPVAEPGALEFELQSESAETPAEEAMREELSAEFGEDSQTFGEDSGGLDNMMPVPEELTRPELPDGQGPDGGKKKKKKKR